MNELIQLLSTPIIINTAQLGVVAIAATLPSLVAFLFGHDIAERKIDRLVKQIEKYNYQLAVELRHDNKIKRYYND